MGEILDDFKINNIICKAQNKVWCPMFKIIRKFQDGSSREETNCEPFWAWKTAQLLRLHAQKNGPEIIQ